jgi:predicted TIM-barrel fold metal-dependent hydrolase
MTEGGCDTHVHVIGARPAWPMAPERHYTPEPAPLEDLQAHLQAVGLQRAVIVQPSVYGTDNALLLQSLERMQGQARGVAVVASDLPLAELKAMDAAGVRGLRINLESASGQDAAPLAYALQEQSARIADLGWHLQVFARLSLVAACAPVLRQLPVPVVLDHFALCPDAHFADADSRALLELLAAGCVYVKLSASYRVPLDGPDVVRTAAHRMLEARPDRILWASDWPHTSRQPGLAAHEVSPYRPITAESLVSERDSWLTTASVRQQVLVDNPARLYRF